MNDDRPKNEKRDANVGVLFWLAALLVLSVFITLLVTEGIFHAFVVHRAAVDRPLPEIAHARSNFPQPSLQVAPTEDLQKMREREERELNSYGWIDRQKGVVRLPIERAIELLSQRGLPDVGQGMTPLQFMQNVPSQNENRTP